MIFTKWLLLFLSMSFLGMSCDSNSKNNDARLKNQLNCDSLKECTESYRSQCPDSTECISGICSSSPEKSVCFDNSNGSYDRLCKLLCGHTNCGLLESNPLQISCN